MGMEEGARREARLSRAMDVWMVVPVEEMLAAVVELVDLDECEVRRRDLFSRGMDVLVLVPVPVLVELVELVDWEVSRVGRLKRPI